MKVCVACENPIPEGKRCHAKYCSDLCGNKVRRERFVQTQEAKARKLALQNERRNTPIGKYESQKEAAIQRGIGFYLTFWEWWELWEPHWENRGVGNLCMCRNSDLGPYIKGNVRIDTWANNIREAKGLPLKFA